MWGMVLSALFSKRYLKKLGGGSSSGGGAGAGFGDRAMTAMFIGLICAYLGSYIGGFVSGGEFPFNGDWSPLAVAGVSALTMAVCVYLSEKKGMAWLESFSIAGSMLVGMAAAVLLRLAV